MNWTPEKLERFWKKCGAYPDDNRGYWRITTGRFIGYPNGTWDNPIEINLETLLDVLKKLVKERGYNDGTVIRLELDSIGTFVKIPRLDIETQYFDTEKESVVSAICALIGLEEK